MEVLLYRKLKLEQNNEGMEGMLNKKAKGLTTLRLSRKERVNQHKA